MQGHRIGYVRVSSFDQNPERQLEQTQVSKVFNDRNLNPKKIKKTPKNGCLFNTACVP